MGKWVPVDERLARLSHDEGECRIWHGSTSGRGSYGQIRVDGVLLYAHRVAWEVANGPIPEGMQVDHLCRQTLCIRPDHLEPVTPEENMRRSRGWRQKAACKYGHPFTEDNVYRDPRGHRGCRTCRRGRLKQWRAEGNDSNAARARKNATRVVVS
jgi:hypothetical protein